MVRLDDPYLLSEKQIKFFRKNNFIKLKNVFDKATINHYNEVISKAVESIETTKVPLEDRDTYGKAFLQLFNLWQHNKDVRDFVFSKRLAKIASDLMGVTGVRLYHDQALFKEAGGGITPTLIGLLNCYQATNDNKILELAQLIYLNYRVLIYQIKSL